MSLIKWIVRYSMAEFSYIIKTKYQDTLDTLKNTSFDKNNNIYLCQSDMKVVDFDALTLKLHPQKQPASYDALIVEESDKEIFCIEFKNQHKTDINNQQLRKKVVDSDATLKKLCKENNIAKDNYKYKLCIVYKRDTKYKYRRFKENIVRFGLENYKGKYFDSVVTNDIVFFRKEFQKKYGCC